MTDKDRETVSLPSQAYAFEGKAVRGQSHGSETRLPIRPYVVTKHGIYQSAVQPDSNTIVHYRASHAKAGE